MKIIDRLNLKESKRTKNQAGFLVLPDCTLARSGTLEYSEVEDENGNMIADGQLITVYRPPQAVKECVSQFSNLPLTCHHPENNEVNPHNAKSVTVGSLGQNPRCETHDDGEVYVKCDIIVYDDDTIKKIENGELEELSAGYETAFKSKNALTPNGTPYQAEQFYLSPNHVALVPRGRCGSECRVCDEAEKTKEENMAKKNAKTARWLLSIGDSDEAVEITAEQAEKLQKEDPTIEVEEITEDQLEETDEDVCAKCGNEEKTLDEEEIEIDEDEKKTDDVDKRELIDEIGGILKDKVSEEDWRTIIGKVEAVAYNASESGEGDEDEAKEDECEKEDEDEVRLEDEVKEDEDEKKPDNDLVYEVQFDDGTIGKMDEEAFKKVDRLMDVTKKSDSDERTFAAMAKLTSAATKILGDSFDVADYIKSGVVDSAEIKKACIKKVMPNVVTRNLCGDALDQVFRSAIATRKNNADTWQNDVRGLAEASKNNVTDGAGVLETARAAYLKRQHKEG